MAEDTFDITSRKIAESVLSLKIAPDGMTILRLIKMYLSGGLVDAVRCTECAKASCCPIGTKPIAEKMACVDGKRKDIASMIWDGMSRAPETDK